MQLKSLYFRLASKDPVGISGARTALISASVLLVLLSVAFGQDAIEPFAIQVTVNYLDMELQEIGGATYLAWHIYGVNPGDTAAMELGEAVHLVNNCNVLVDLFSTVRDFPDSGTADTLWMPWEVWTIGGVDTCGFRWASEAIHAVPPFSNGVPIYTASTPVEADIPAGEDRYLFAWLLLPTDGEYGEQHRLISEILITPAIAH